MLLWDWTGYIRRRAPHPRRGGLIIERCRSPEPKSANRRDARSAGRVDAGSALTRRDRLFLLRRRLGRRATTRLSVCSVSRRSSISRDESRHRARRRRHRAVAARPSPDDDDCFVSERRRRRRHHHRRPVTSRQKNYPIQVSFRAYYSTYTNYFSGSGYIEQSVHCVLSIN